MVVFLKIFIQMLIIYTIKKSNLKSIDIEQNLGWADNSNIINIITVNNQWKYV